MIKTTIKTKLNFPEFATIQDDLLFLAEREIIPDIIRGIHARRAISGGSLPDNEPATIKHKGVNRPLIDTGKLAGSLIANKSGKSKVIIKINPEREKIAGYLQIDGISTKHGVKHYKFFGISKNAENTCMEYIRKRIKQALKNAR